MSINNLHGELITPLATHANAAIAASRVRATLNRSASFTEKPDYRHH
jgi:hypothetical protein